MQNTIFGLESATVEASINWKIPKPTNINFVLLFIFLLVLFVQERETRSFPLHLSNVQYSKYRWHIMDFESSWGSLLFPFAEYKTPHGRQ